MTTTGIALTREKARGLDIDQAYADHAQFIARVLYRIAGPGPHVDDLLQETFIVAYRRQHEFDGRSSVRTWLYSIAIRLCMRHARSLKRFYRFKEKFSNEPREFTDQPDRELDRKAKQALVHQVLDKLPIKQREVFVLFELEELEGKEISEMLKVPEGTIWTRLHHARKRFKQLMQNRLEREGK